MHSEKLLARATVPALAFVTGSHSVVYAALEFTTKPKGALN